jgi:hypothetical protein
MNEILWLVVGNRAPKGLSHDFSHPSDEYAYAVVMWFGGTALAQDLHGEALVKALQKDGYILVMRHASLPREVPDKPAANPDNSKPERQLDEGGRNTAIAWARRFTT